MTDEENEIEKVMANLGNRSFGSLEQRVEGQFRKFVKTELKSKLYNIVYVWFMVRKYPKPISSTDILQFSSVERRTINDFLVKMVKFGILRKRDDAGNEQYYNCNIERLKWGMEDVKVYLLEKNPLLHADFKKEYWDKIDKIKKKGKGAGK